MFVIFASLKGEYQVAFGSAIGSCSLLTTLGYGMVILLATSKLSKQPVRFIELSKETGIDAVYLFTTAFVALLLSWEEKGLDVKDGIILTILFAGYIYQITRQAIAHISERSQQEKSSLEKQEFLKGLLYLFVGGIIIIAASEPFVDSMIKFATLIKISPVVIAIILGPLASEMPEKITAYITVLRNGSLAEISICNFIGSKVNHNSLLLALIPFIAAGKGHGQIYNAVTPSFVLMFCLTLFATASLARRKLEKWQGFVFTGLYIFMLVFTFATH